MIGIADGSYHAHYFGQIKVDVGSGTMPSRKGSRRRPAISYLFRGVAFRSDFPVRKSMGKVFSPCVSPVRG
jgi:hypothetical protein